MCSSRWNDNWKGKPKYSDKTCPIATFSTTNPTLPDLGSNPGRRGGKPATNCLSYSTALVLALLRASRSLAAMFGPTVIRPRTGEKTFVRPVTNVKHHSYCNTCISEFTVIYDDKKILSCFEFMGVELAKRKTNFQLYLKRLWTRRRIRHIFLHNHTSAVTVAVASTLCVVALRWKAPTILNRQPDFGTSFIQKNT
jgi:hypothetical protein